MVEVDKEDAKPRCEHCKFCAVRIESWDNEKLELVKVYSCKFFPQEILTRRNNWCGQFKRKENERNGNL